MHRLRLPQCAEVVREELIQEVMERRCARLVLSGITPCLPQSHAQTVLLASISLRRVQQAAPRVRQALIQVLTWVHARIVLLAPIKYRRDPRNVITAQLVSTRS